MHTEHEQGARREEAKKQARPLAIRKPRRRRKRSAVFVAEAQEDPERDTILVDMRDSPEYTMPPPSEWSHGPVPAPDSVNQGLHWWNSPAESMEALNPGLYRESRPTRNAKPRKFTEEHALEIRAMSDSLSSVELMLQYERTARQEAEMKAEMVEKSTHWVATTVWHLARLLGAYVNQSDHFSAGPQIQEAAVQAAEHARVARELLAPSNLPKTSEEFARMSAELITGSDQATLYAPPPSPRTGVM